MDKKIRALIERYFIIVDRYISDIRLDMINSKSDPHLTAIKYSEDLHLRENLLLMIHDLYNEVNDYWNENYSTIYRYSLSILNMKASFGGDVFPSYARNIVLNTGLYVETFILPDPIYTIENRFKTTVSERNYIYYMVKHALNLFNYKSLALANVENPIVLILPMESIIQKGKLEKSLLKDAKENTLLHLGELYGRQFDTELDALQYSKNILEVNDFERLVKRQDFFLFDADKSNLTLEEVREELLTMYQVVSNEISFGESIYYHIMGRALQSNDLSFKSKLHSSIPLIDAPTSWRYMLMKYEVDAINGSKDNSNYKENLLVASLAQKEVPILSNLHYSTLLRLREENALGDLRKIISDGINEISSATIDDFSKVSHEVVRNITSSFEGHQKEMIALERAKKNFYGYEIPKLLFTGGLSIAAAALQSTELSLLAAGSNFMFGSNSVLDVKKSIGEIREMNSEIKSSPISLFSWT